MTYGGKRRRRRVWIAASVAGVMVVGGGAAAGWYYVRPALAAAQSCDVVKDRIAKDGPVIHVSDANPTVAVIGDSYTAGDGLPDRSKGWARSVGTDLDGIGMTGFTNGGYCGHQTFSERIDNVLATKPDTLIVQGGLNDVEKPGEVQASAMFLMSQVKDVRRVVIVGPVDAPAREGEEAVDNALRTAAASTGRQYVSALDWDLPFLADKTHLTPDGHAEFAQHVRESLAKSSS